MLAMLRLAAAQTAPAISPAISTPDTVGTRIGTLEFKDGAPSAETVSKIYTWTSRTHSKRATVLRPTRSPCRRAFRRPIFGR
jgi:hypothetical protein